MQSEPTDNINIVIDMLRREQVPLLPSEVAKWGAITPGAARRALQQLEREGVVVKNNNGYYGLAGGASTVSERTE